jgi:hypothetical protein
MSRPFRIIASLAILFLAALIACGDDDGVEPQTDTLAPAPITDLSCIDRTDVSVTLSWTATGDDTTSGTARSYQIRYSLSEITAGNWSSATVAAGAPTPKTAGSPETHLVSGLSSNETYHFAIRAADETPNWSAVSNSPDTTTDVPQLFAITTDQYVNHSPAYSPDGTMIAYASRREGQGEEIWIKSATVTDGPATRITTFSNTGVYYSQSPSWSPSGDSLVFHSDVLGTFDIWGVDISGNPPYTPFQIAVDQSHNEWFPEWSHNGSKIAFSSDQDAGGAEVYYVSPAGGAWTRVTNDAYLNEYPTWSPDDLYIAYASVRASQNESIFKIRLSDKAITQLSFEGAQEQHPSWARVRIGSTNYENVAYVQNSSETVPAARWNVAFAHSDGTGMATLVTSATDGLHQTYPCWSPNGKRIAYTYWTAGGNTFIYSQLVFQ